MTQKQLDRAITITKRIGRLRLHLFDIKVFDNADSDYSEPSFIGIRPRNSRAGTKDLEIEFLPMTPESLMEEYYKNIEKEIEKLEKEFEEL